MPCDLLTGGNLLLGDAFIYETEDRPRHVGMSYATELVALNGAGVHPVNACGSHQRPLVKIILLAVVKRCLFTSSPPSSRESTWKSEGPSGLCFDSLPQHLRATGSLTG